MGSQFDNCATNTGLWLLHGLNSPCSSSQQTYQLIMLLVITCFPTSHTYCPDIPKHFAFLAAVLLIRMLRAVR